MRCFLRSSAELLREKFYFLATIMLIFYVEPLIYVVSLWLTTGLQHISGNVIALFFDNHLVYTLPPVYQTNTKLLLHEECILHRCLLFRKV